MQQLQMTAAPIATCIKYFTYEVECWAGSSGPLTYSRIETEMRALSKQWRREGSIFPPPQFIPPHCIVKILSTLSTALIDNPLLQCSIGPICSQVYEIKLGVILQEHFKSS